MPQDNVEIVRRVIAANRSDRSQTTPDDTLALFDPECEFTSAMGAVDQRLYRGREGLRRYLQDMEEAWSEWWVEAEEISEPRPGTVLAIIRPHVVAKESGIPLASRRATIYEFSGPMIKDVRNFGTPAEALDAMGLAE